MAYHFYRYFRYKSSTSVDFIGPSGLNGLNITTTAGLTQIYGPPLTGNDLEIYGSQADTYPKFKLNGAGNMNFQADMASGGKAVIFYDTTIQCVRYDHTANTSTVSGGGVTGDALILKGNSIDATPTLKIVGNDAIYFGVHTGTGDVACNGHITIKDAAGNTRKLMTTA